MTINLTNEEFFFLVVMAGADSILGAAGPDNDDIAHLRKRYRVLAKEMMAKKMLSIKGNEYKMEPPLADFIYTCCFSDLSWVLTPAVGSEVYFHITAQMVVEIINDRKNVILKSYTNIDELYARVKEIVGFAPAPKRDVSFTISRDKLEEILRLAEEGNKNGAVEALAAQGLNKGQAETFVDAGETDGSKAFIMTFHNKKQEYKSINTMFNNQYNLAIEVDETKGATVTACSFEDLIKLLTFVG